ncbi:MFS transporter [Nocardia sp. NPDC006630]|uniref:MFS transporter n=1 Tax=Nocardia sp. NPDC006630 TaxID=3157181 RepID=UPI0033B937A9
MLVSSLLIVIMDNTILNVALRTIQDDLSATQAQMQWATDSYMVVFAGLLIASGVLGDRIGRRLMLLIGMVMFGIGSTACAFAHTPVELIVCRALLGVGAAAVQPQTLSIIQNTFPPHERAKAIGAWSGASGIAIALGPIVGGALIKYFWWGSVFLVNVPVTIAGFIGILLLVPESRDPRPGRFDLVGAVLSVLAMLLLVYGVIEGGNSGHWLRWNTGGMIAAGLLFGAVFIRYEQSIGDPMIDTALFRNRFFSSGVAVIALIFFAITGATFYLSYYLQAVRGYTPLATGVALIAVAAGMMVTSMTAAALTRRAGANVVAGTGLMLFAVSMIAFIFATTTMPLWVLEIQITLAGMGLGLTLTPATEAIMAAVPDHRAGSGAGANNTMRQLASALGVAVLGSVLQLTFHHQFDTERPVQLAAALDRPMAATTQLPESAQVGPEVKPESADSITDALGFANRSIIVLQDRARQTAAQPISEDTRNQQQARARTLIEQFTTEADHAFVDGIRVASVLAAIGGLIGAAVAFGFLPRRRTVPTTPIRVLETA